jgi:hypothetical protein
VFSKPVGGGTLLDLVKGVAPIGERVEIAVFAALFLLGVAYTLYELDVYWLNFFVKGYLSDKRRGGSAGALRAHAKLVKSVLKLLQRDGVTRETRSAARLMRKNSGLRDRISRWEEKRALRHGGVAAPNGQEGRDGASFSVPATGGAEDRSVLGFRRRIEENERKIRKRIEGASRKLVRAGVTVDPDELGLLMLTVSGRCLVESAVAVKSGCGLIPKICRWIAMSRNLGEARGSVMLFRAILVAAEKQAHGFEDMIKNVYLPRLDAVVREEYPLAVAGSRAVGGPACRAAEQAAGRSVEHYRAMTEAHAGFLNELRSTLVDCSHSMLRASRGLEPDDGPAASLMDLLISGGGKPARVMEESADLLKARLNHRPGITAFCGKGREGLIREIDELVVQVSSKKR